MDQAPKTRFSPEGSVKDLPLHLDALLDGITPRNMHPAEVFHEYPALSMIAQIVTDYAMTNYGLHKEDISVFVHEDTEISAITFDAAPARDGSIDPSIQARLCGALADFENVILTNSLNDVVDVSLPAICIGADSDKSGFVALLQEFALENGCHIGPTPEGSRLKSIGAFTIADIQEALIREKKRVQEIGQTFHHAAVPEDKPAQFPEQALSPYARTQVTAANFGAILDLVLGEKTHQFILSPHRGGYRYIMWASEIEGAEEKIDALFQGLAGDVLPEGVTMSAEDWIFRIDNDDAFERLYQFTISKFGAEIPAEDFNGDGQDQDDETSYDSADAAQGMDEFLDADEMEVPFWNRPEPENAPDLVCAILYGLSRYRFGLDNTDWTWVEHKGEYHFAPLIVEDEIAQHAKLINMMQSLNNDGGAWQDLSINNQTGTIITSDIRMICNMLEKFAEENEFVFGDKAIDTIKLGVLSEDILFESSVILGADPSLINGLGNRSYITKEAMLGDVQKLLQTIAGGRYASPYTPDDVYHALIRQPRATNPQMQPEPPHA